EVVVVENDAPPAAIGTVPYEPGFAPVSNTTWQRTGGQGNVGYGQGHNIVLREHDSDLYLVLNPDAVLAPDALTRAIEYLRTTPECGVVAPYAAGPDGEPLFLCKRYPDALTLLLRAAASGLQRSAKARMARYEMRDIVGDDARTAWPGVTLASGCCMLMRTDIVRCTNGFDPRFFVYF